MSERMIEKLNSCMSIIPLPTLLIDEAAILFEMEVVSKEPDWDDQPGYCPHWKEGTVI